MKRRSSSKNPAKLRDYLTDPFLKKFYGEQKRKLEVAQELYGMDEDDYLALWTRVIVTKDAADDDEERFDVIINQVYREFGINR